MKTVIKVKNLDCPNCAQTLERELLNIDGIAYCEVSFVSQKITLDGEESAIEIAKKQITSFEEVEIVEEEQPLSESVLRLENLHCAACALDLERDLQKIKGVEKAQVDFISQTARVSVQDKKTLAAVVKKINRFEKVRVLNEGELSLPPSYKKEIIQIALSVGFFLLAILFGELLTGKVFEILSYVFFGIAYLSVGYPVLFSTAKNVVKGRVFDENFLMSVASIGAFCIGEVVEGVAVMLLYQIGELLQSVAVGASRGSIAALMDLKSEYANRLLENGEAEKISPEQLKIGDTVLVKTGERVPADGVLLSKNATLDVKSLTGESAYKESEKGEEILSGSINVGGVITLKTVREYQDSAVQKILNLVENSTSKKAKSEKFISKFARFYTPIVCALALIIATVAPMIEGVVQTGGFAFVNFTYWLKIALTFLVVSCPCALVISVPLTYFCGIGVCAKKGILVKGATHLDTLAKSKAFAFDKTGTLTYGNFKIKEIHPIGVEKEYLLSLVALAEKSSAHPIAKAFSAVQTNGVLTDIKEIAGKGITACYKEKTLLVGNDKLLEENVVNAPDYNGVETAIFAALDGVCIGFIEIGDEEKTGAKEVIQGLKSLGIEHVCMLTGDGEKKALSVASTLGLDGVKAGLLPDKKLEEMNCLKEKYGVVTYVGDGVNDAPVMTQADCAVSMGKLGSAAAVEASDLVLVSDRLELLIDGLKTARKTRRIVTQNILFSIVMKIGFMLLAAFGILHLWLAVFADVGVMLLAVLNSLRVRTKRS